MQIPAGVPVVTADDRIVGVVTTAGDKDFFVDLDGDGQVRLSTDLVDHVRDGRLVLLVDSTVLRDRVELPAPPAQPGGGHVPLRAIELLWGEMHKRAWDELDRVAHIEAAGDKRRVDAHVLSDIIDLSHAAQEADEAFPETLRELCTVLERRAAR